MYYIPILSIVYFKFQSQMELMVLMSNNSQFPMNVLIENLSYSLLELLLNYVQTFQNKVL